MTTVLDKWELSPLLVRQIFDVLDKAIKNELAYVEASVVAARLDERDACVKVAEHYGATLIAERIRQRGHDE